MNEHHRPDQPAKIDGEEARQGSIIRHRPMIRVLGISLALTVVAMLLAYLFVF